jgi:hypothetical protein
MRWRLALCWAVLGAPAWGQDFSGLLALDRAGRAIAAARCARPQEVKVSQVGSTGDEMHAIDCRTFRLAVYAERIGATLREAPMALVVQAEIAGLPDGLAVGADPAAVLARLGPPTHQRGDSFSYLLDPSRPAGDSITFEIEAGRVRAIAWNWKVD